jgi:nitrate reductase NapE component
MFLFLTVVLAPALAVAIVGGYIVGGYGLIVWIAQIVNGPPGI